MAVERAGERGETAMFAQPAEAVTFRAPHLPVSATARPAPAPYAPALYFDTVLRAAAGKAGWLGARPDARRIGAAIGAAARLELERGIAFLAVPVCLATGVLGYFGLDAEPGFAPLLAGMLLSGLSIWTARSNRAARAALLGIALMLAGALAAKLETWRAGTAMIGGEVTTRLTARVAAVEQMANGRVRLTLDIVATERPVLRYAPARVRLSARKLMPGIRPGTIVTGLVRLLPPSGPVRPGAYDFSFQSYFQRIGATGYFMAGPELAATPATGPALGRDIVEAVERFRDDVARRVRARVGGAEGEIAAALVVGVRGGIPEPVNEALRRAGLYHVISISGLHMALVAGTIMALLRTGLALFPNFASRRPVKKYATVAALVGLAAYLVVSGAEVAAQRSFLMLSIMLLALLFDRGALTMRNLAIAAIAVLLVSPHEIVGPSFQMSYAATAGLVGAYAAWSARRRAVPHPAPANRSVVSAGLRRLLLLAGGLASTSLIAGLATSVFAAWHFQQLSSLGLFANLAAMPVVSTLVMPFAVLGLLLMPAGLDGWCLDVMGMGLTITISIAQWFSERSPLDQVGLVPSTAVALFTLGLIAATVCTTWFRAVSLPLFAAGLFFLPTASAPDLLISEDGSLLGMPDGAGGLVVNDPRPAEFTVENWMRVFVADRLVKPVERHGTDGGIPAGAAFACGDGLCLARHAAGGVVAHAATVEAARAACAMADVIVLQDAAATDVCRDRQVRIVTLRDLARYGSAEVRFGSARPAIRHALSRPYRPWHESRAFSREARGLPPYRPAGRPTGPEPPATDRPDQGIDGSGLPARRGAEDAAAGG